MDILQNNPYRLLGAYANSPTKERLANLNRMKAFLKVGKHVSFPLDLSEDLLPVNRTESVVADADAKLTLPKDQILYAQFWFIKMTPLDDVAFNHLIAGEIDKAEEIWQKRECASSLQNRIVCALIFDDYACAIACAEILYGNSQYVGQLVTAIVGTGGNFDVSNLAFSFLDVLCEEIGANKLLPSITNNEWKNHIVEKAVKPLIDSIQEDIEIAKKFKGKGPNARLNAGETLRRNTKSALLQLKGFLSATDLQYQMIADKLGLEILQCGIDYYNDSEEPDAAYKAMSLQKYAKDIVVGQMAKDRCTENVSILQKIIDNQPPSEVFAEDRAIHEELRKYCQLPDLICHAITLLNNVKPYLMSIKSKMGIANEYYLKISTQVVGNALHNIIEEVNQAQTYDPAEERRQQKLEERKSILFGYHLYSPDLPDFLYESEDRRKKYERIKSVVLEAREALVIMDVLDMEKTFEQERYLPNRKTLNEFLIHLEKPLPAYKPVPLKKKVEIVLAKNGNIIKDSLMQIWKNLSTYKLQTLGKKIEMAAKVICKAPKWIKENPTASLCVVFIIISMVIGSAINGAAGVAVGFIVAILFEIFICVIFDFLKNARE